MRNKNERARGSLIALFAVVAGCGAGGDASPVDAGTFGSRDAETEAVSPDTAEPASDTGAGSDTRESGVVEPDAARTDGAPIDVTVTDVARSDAPAIDAPVNPGADAACGACASYGAPVLTGTVQSSNLNALSGIAASWRNVGVVYVHNDRNRPEFFALSESGALLGQFSLTGAVVQDLEDIEVARCASGTCVYLADIGGNITPRTEFAVLRVPEPEVSPTRPGGTAQVTFERFAFTYPDGGAHNAESLLVDPSTGNVYIITKLAAGQRSTVYRLPMLDASRAVTAVKVVDLTVPAASDQPATAASAHPCGAGFLLRTGNMLYEFRIAIGAPFEDAFRATPAMVPVGAEMQGEGVSYRSDGRGYYTTSEGASPPIHRVVCAPTP